ncbi:hypothetical protein A3Q56_02190 [Intoshia linei]|uniref:Phosphorylated adapter RNA export protein n=1 Tax=Intoshia linei TaxID=1819745 RepID=A0A177B8S8_9BILA|nr:hypothetical protein A3Q56_02190 [Intoshia linei]
MDELSCKLKNVKIGQQTSKNVPMKKEKFKKRTKNTNFISKSNFDNLESFGNFHPIIRKTVSVTFSTSMLDVRHSLQVRDEKEKVVRTIARLLNERKIPIIDRIYETIGPTRLLDYFDDTLEIERNGGMKTNSFNLRRSPGGVLFSLIKNSDHISSDEKNSIFLIEKQRHQKNKRIKRNRKKNEKLKPFNVPNKPE